MRVAILGAGAIGTAIAQRLAERARVREVRLIDNQGQVAAGKALDILQSGPIGKYDTQLTATADPLAAAGSDVVIVADDTATGEWEGDRGLALLQRLDRAGVTGPIVLAGPKQAWLMEAAIRELKMAPDRLVGSAAAAAVNAAAALVHIELGETGASVAVTGRPPSLVIGWSSASIGGTLVTERVAAHRLLALSATLQKLWPPGPQAIAAPTALIAEALTSGSRRLLPALTILDGEFGLRGRSALLPLELGNGRILRRVVPSLSPQERTEMITVVSR
jgi:malate dehydrogenase